MKEEYILVLNKGVSSEEFDDIIKRHGIRLNRENYDNLDRHFKVTFDNWRKADIKKEANVFHVCEADAPITLMATQTINVDATGKGDNWGLSRIGKRDEWKDYDIWYPNSGVYEYSRTGKGVDIYIVDTGARITHSDFTGRIEVIYDHYLPKTDPNYGMDLQGHGTHVASTAAGTKYGVAKNARILVSRVFETGGATLSAIIAGINACAAHHKAKRAARSDRASVMNLSLGGPAQRIEEQAINDCIDSGIVCVAAAGNDGKNLAEEGYDVMPAEIERAITVGSVDIQDYVSSFSNYGSMVDVFAPGHYISAAGFDGDSAEKMLSGTSMASPHVAGVCALYLEGFGITIGAENVAEVHDWVRDNSTPNTVHLSESLMTAGTANRLLYSEFIKDAPIAVVEVSRSSSDEVTVDVSKSTPIITTSAHDDTDVTTLANGNIVTTVTRYYTDTSTVMVTTTTTTVTTTIIVYSDKTTKTVIGDPAINTVLSDEITVNEHSTVISEIITEPTPEPNKGKERKWWRKRDRRWISHRNSNYSLRTIKRLESMYARIKQDDGIESKLEVLEIIADELTYLRRREKVQKFAEFITIRNELATLIWNNRRN